MFTEIETDQLNVFEKGPRQELESVHLALERLRIPGTDIYRAADPGYPGNFSRDSLIAAELGRDYQALGAQIDYSASNQGIKHDPVSGEEPGKIHHELPAVEYRGDSTAYNACDTTALFLLGITTLSKYSSENIFEKYQDNIDAGIKYIQDHTEDDGIFYEKPPKGAKSYALRVTYWKDSELNSSEKSEPKYPVVYSLAHFMNADALLKIGSVMDNQNLIDQAHEMYKAGVEKLWAGDHFVTAIDADGDLFDAPSTDSLYALLHMPPLLLPQGYAKAIERYMDQLETDAGYRAGLPWQNRDNYHTDYIWVHEQALLNAAANLHGLSKSKEISSRVTKYINQDEELYPELLSVHNNFEPAGNRLQLWSVRAFQYFIS